MEKKTRIFGIIYFCMIFVAIFIFFTKIHPILLFDVDDWRYIATKRHPIPLWGDWNPTRVFPEVLMPLCGDIAAFIIYPLTGNYIDSFTIVNGAAVSIFIVLYLYMFFSLLRRKLQIPAYQAFIMTIIFLLLHFFVFLSRWWENEYLFLSPDATCYYYYLIPALLNCSLVLYLMRNDVLENGWEKITSHSFIHHVVRDGILLLAFYMALFSNLYESAILAAFIGSQLLLKLVTLLKTGGTLKSYIKNNILRIVFIVAWLVEQLFEVNGGRSKQLTASLGKTGGFSFTDVIATLRAMAAKVGTINKFFVIGSILIIISSLAIYRFNRIGGKPPVKNTSFFWGGVLKLSVISGILMSAYIALLDSRVGNIHRSDVWLGIMFFVFLVLSMCVLYILKKVQVANILLPMLCCFLLFETRTVGRTFRDMPYISDHGLSNSDCIAIDMDMISQVIKADQEGQKEMILYVPDFKTVENWPLGTWGGNYLSETLYRHGLIDHSMHVEMVPSQDKNEELNLR